jgi:hypothetical protein
MINPARLQHPEDGGGVMDRQGQSTHHTQEGVPADRSAQAMAELGPCRPAEGHRDLRQPWHQPLGPPGPGRHELGPAPNRVIILFPLVGSLTDRIGSS